MARQYVLRAWPEATPAAAFAAGAGAGISIYRGPDLAGVWHGAADAGAAAADVDPAAARWRRALQSQQLLAAVEMPGLPEARPALAPQDAVYVRLAADPRGAPQYAGAVAATDGARVLLVMPPAWWARLERLRAGAKAAADAAAAPPLVHVAVAPDRTAFARMHEALEALWLSPRPLLPPPLLPPAVAAMAAAAATAPAAPPPRADLEARAAALQLRGATPLNAEQRRAVAALLLGGGRRLPYALFGPPGTGKSVTLVEAILQVRANFGPHARVLAAAPTNFSADLIASALAAAGVKAGEMLRLNDPRHPPAQTKDDVRPFCRYDEATGYYRLPAADELRGAAIVVASCVAAVRRKSRGASRGSLQRVMRVQCCHLGAFCVAPPWRPRRQTKPFDGGDNNSQHPLNPQLHRASSARSRRAPATPRRASISSSSTRRGRRRRPRRSCR